MTIQNALKKVPTLTDQLKVLMAPFMVTPWRAKLSATRTSGIEEGMIKITPTFANFLLENHNPRNRNLSTDKLNKLRQTMDREWNADMPDSTILFGQDGMLKNGQHRLNAIVLLGREIVSRIEVGHEDSILFHLDQHFTRSEKAQAQILDRPQDERNDYAAVKMLYQIEHERTDFPFPRYEVFTLIDDRYGSDLFKIVPVTFMKDPVTGGGRHLIYTIRATLLFLAIHYPNEVTEFMRQLRDRDFVDGYRGGPGLLYDYMTTSKHFITEKQTYRGKWAQVMRTFKAFHLFMKHETRDRLRAATDSAIAIRKTIDKDYRPKAEGPFAKTTYERRRDEED